jgi:hypothetical protein
MDHEGMVHALEEIHRLLRPAGTLIEIHPALEVPFVEVRADGDVVFSEADPGFDYEDDLRHAEAAVATAIAVRLFVRDASRQFELRSHASSVRELRDHWAVAGAYDPHDRDEALARQQEEMFARAHHVLERSSTAELVYVEPATISRLIAVVRTG